LDEGGAGEVDLGALRPVAKTERSPLRTIVGMSNEGPEDPALLAAFYDRFALKLTVEYLDGDDFAAMLRAVREPDASKCPVEITEADFAALDRLVAACEFADDLVGVLASIRATLKAKGVVVSDRRYAQCVRLLKAAAVLDGRNAVSRRDLSVLEYVLWNQPAERAIIRALPPDYANPHERELPAILDELHAQRGEVNKAANYTPAGGTPADTTRPSPDLVAAAGEAAKAYGRAKSIATRLDLIEPDTDSDREAHALACQHAEAVVEAIKLVAGVGESLAGRLLLFDARAPRWHEVRLSRDPHCAVCGEPRAAAA
ncbi:MAG TPA: hypothetical protein PKW35_26080, partial [Nannocystaceae bacterium]|nr:hypothetical protein [Nannocystaceae bacterium]